MFQYSIMTNKDVLWG